MKLKISKKIIISIAILLAVAGGSFYGGIFYEKSRSPINNFAGGANRQNRTGQGQQGNTRFGGAGASGMASGEIVSKSNGSVTVKMRNNSSKIIVLPGSVSISKPNPGTLDDLSAGTEITVMGSPNSDGSITAQTIQIRPASSTIPELPPQAPHN